MQALFSILMIMLPICSCPSLRFVRCVWLAKFGILTFSMQHPSMMPCDSNCGHTCISNQLLRAIAKTGDFPHQVVDCSGKKHVWGRVYPQNYNSVRSEGGDNSATPSTAQRDSTCSSPDVSIILLPKGPVTCIFSLIAQNGLHTKSYPSSNSPVSPSIVYSTSRTRSTFVETAMPEKTVQECPACQSRTGTPFHCWHVVQHGTGKPPGIIYITSLC